MSPGPTSLLRMPPDAGRGRPPAQSSIAFRFCIFCSLPLKGTPQHSRGVLQVGEGSMAREESRRVHVGQTAERAEPAKPEKNHDRMGLSSFWRWQRCCAANCSQPPCCGTLNRGRSRYIGYKRRLLRLYHHKHFRWRAFDLRDLRTSNFKSIARRAPAPIDAQTPASKDNSQCSRRARRARPVSQHRSCSRLN